MKLISKRKNIKVKKIDFNEKISFNDNEYRKRMKMEQNSFTAAVNDNLKIYKFENPAGRNLFFFKCNNNCYLKFTRDSRHAYRGFPNVESEFSFQSLKKPFRSAK